MGIRKKKRKVDRWREDEEDGGRWRNRGIEGERKGEKKGDFYTEIFLYIVYYNIY